MFNILSDESKEDYNELNDKENNKKKLFKRFSRKIWKNYSNFSHFDYPHEKDLINENNINSNFKSKKVISIEEQISSKMIENIKGISIDNSISQIEIFLSNRKNHKLNKLKKIKVNLKKKINKIDEIINKKKKFKLKSIKKIHKTVDYTKKNRIKIKKINQKILKKKKQLQSKFNYKINYSNRKNKIFINILDNNLRNKRKIIKC